jgi:hypothetical protein
MKFLQEIAKSYSNTKLLKQRYRLVTNTVGLFGVMVGVAIAALLGKLAHLQMPIQMPSGMLGTAALAVVIVVIAAFFYLGCVIVAGLLGCVMVYRGKFTKREAMEYALYSKYPRHWFPVSTRPNAPADVPAAPGRR